MTFGKAIMAVTGLGLILFGLAGELGLTDRPFTAFHGALLVINYLSVVEVRNDRP